MSTVAGVLEAAQWAKKKADACAEGKDVHATDVIAHGTRNGVVVSEVQNGDGADPSANVYILRSVVHASRAAVLDMLSQPGSRPVFDPCCLAERDLGGGTVTRKVRPILLPPAFRVAMGGVVVVMASLLAFGLAALLVSSPSTGPYWARALAVLLSVGTIHVLRTYAASALVPPTCELTYVVRQQDAKSAGSAAVVVEAGVPNEDGQPGPSGNTGSALFVTEVAAGRCVLCYVVPNVTEAVHPRVARVYGPEMLLSRHIAFVASLGQCLEATNRPVKTAAKRSSSSSSSKKAAAVAPQPARSEQPPAKKKTSGGDGGEADNNKAAAKDHQQQQQQSENNTSSTASTEKKKTETAGGGDDAAAAAAGAAGAGGDDAGPASEAAAPAGYKMPANRFSTEIETLIESIQHAITARESDGWKYHATNKDIKIFKKSFPGTPVTAVLGEGVRPVPPRAVYDLVSDLDQKTKIDGQFKGGKILEEVVKDEENDADVLVVYQEFKPVWPTSARDFVNFSHKRQLGEDKFIIVAKSCTHAAMPEKKGNVRAEIVMGGWYIEPVHVEGARFPHSRIIFVAQADLKGSLPTRITNMVANEQPLQIDKAAKLAEKGDLTKYYK